ncbi:hypothetical protein J4474_00015 [Candidatus Pacearchaeota archaeon]|nr:hypothetical protein [Candidatus Pacearchaeota archaeon]
MTSQNLELVLIVLRENLPKIEERKKKIQRDEDIKKNYPLYVQGVFVETIRDYLSDNRLLDIVSLYKKPLELMTLTSGEGNLEWLQIDPDKETRIYSHNGSQTRGVRTVTKDKTINILQEIFDIYKKRLLPEKFTALEIVKQNFGREIEGNLEKYIEGINEEIRLVSSDK